MYSNCICAQEEKSLRSLNLALYFIVVIAAAQRMVSHCAASAAVAACSLRIIEHLAILLLLLCAYCKCVYDQKQLDPAVSQLYAIFVSA